MKPLNFGLHRIYPPKKYSIPNGIWLSFRKVSRPKNWNVGEKYYKPDFWEMTIRKASPESANYAFEKKKTAGAGITIFYSRFVNSLKICREPQESARITVSTSLASKGGGGQRRKTWAAITIYCQLLHQNTRAQRTGYICVSSYAFFDFPARLTNERFKWD